MLINEIAGAEDQLALWRLVSNSVQQAIETQRQQQAQAEQDQQAAAAAQTPPQDNTIDSEDQTESLTPQLDDEVNKSVVSINNRRR